MILAAVLITCTVVYFAALSSKPNCARCGCETSPADFICPSCKFPRD